MNITFVGNFNVSYTSETHHANTLESLGHTVKRLQEGKVTAEEIIIAAVGCELLIWVHTHGWETQGHVKAMLEAVQNNGCKVITYHLDLWLGLNRQKDLETDDFYKSIGHFFTVDKKMADWFNSNTTVKGHYMRAGVYEPECYIADNYGAFKHDVAFVGSRGYHPEWPYRPQLVDWLKNNYKQRFAHYGGDGLRVVRGAELNEVYATTKVVVGDTLCIGFDYPYYWSDRVYETLGRGGFLIHPYIKGMEEEFEDKKHLVFYEYGNFGQLKDLIDYYIEHDEEREAIRKAGHEHVKNNCTYTNRWKAILDELYS